MKLINQRLSAEEATILCQSINIIEQTRPRVKEILQIEGELRDSKLANRVASELLRENVIRVDKIRMKVSNHSSDEFPDLDWEPVKIDPLEIYYVTGSRDKAHGPVNIYKLEQLLPHLDMYSTSIFYQGLTHWKSLAELSENHLTSPNN